MTVKKNIYLVQMSMELPDSNYYYFPYSAGVVWAYANSQPVIADNYILGEIFFIKEPIADVISKIHNPAVIGLSSYTWNTNYNEALAKAVKTQWPDCKIIIGGANVPDNDINYFNERPYVDYIIHQEGEISFTALLESFIDGNDCRLIPGISINDNGARITTQKSERIQKLEIVPSPYLTGLFDDMVKKYKSNPDIILNGIIETNRGCPFKCTFCDWGGTTFGKIKKFDIQRIQDEILWFAKNEIEYINNTDANFGILKDKDMAITDFLIKTKKEYGYPVIFDTNWNKNNNSSTIKMASKLLNANMLRRFTASLQSLNNEVLTAIKRTNLNGAQLDNILSAASAAGISISTEMIVGLPMETYNSWQTGICKLLNDDFIVESYPLSVLHNSEMNLPEYKQKYGILTADVKTHFSNYVDEMQTMVIGTRTMPPEMMQRTWLWTWITCLLHANGFTNVLSKYLYLQHNIKYEDFYEKILEESLLDESNVLHKHLKKWQMYATNREYHLFVAGFNYTEVLNDIGITNRKSFFDCILTIAQKMITDKHLLDVVKLQELQQATYDHNDISYLNCKANLNEFIESSAQFKEVDTNYKITQIKIDNRHANWHSFMNFSRKNKGWKNIVWTSE